jgi:threo-3-hydroxy-L-aspartate ammonia-lyase
MHHRFHTVWLIMLNTHSIASKQDLNLAISYQDIEHAASILKGIAHHTPVLRSTLLDEQLNASLFFKCENLQRIGAFKFRGAYYALSRLSQEQQKRGIITYSSGNHAQGIALSAQLLGISATIVMPKDAPAVKLAATRAYGASIVLYNRETEDRVSIAQTLAEEQHLAIIPPFDHPHVMAGQGTAAKELLEEVGILDYLFVCVGGGGLISGSAIAAHHLAPHCKIIGVEPEMGNDAMQSLQQGKIITIPTPKTIADGAQTQSIGKLTFPIMQQHVEDIITVSDQALRDQMRFFVEHLKIVVEPTGCLATAGALSKKIDLSGKRVGIIVSGGNVDPNFFAECIMRK